MNKFWQRIRFELWYYQQPPWDTGITPPEVTAFISEHPAGRALDLGCGTGTNALFLAQQGWQVSAVDFSWKAIRMAQRKARQAGLSVDFRVGDVTQLDALTGPFDWMLDIGCYHNIDRDQRPAYLANLDRFLARGGHFLLYAFLSPEEGGRGLTETDLTLIAEHLTLIDRQDGLDRQRPSSWLTYQR